MRPEKLRIQGFSAYKQPTELDFSDADVFVLTGPTGSGKTSILDAICYALYGTVPRVGKNAIEPVIALGCLEARVEFEFSIDSDPYRVVRVAKRTKTGATSEAVLEGGRFVGEDKVTGSIQVTRAVEGLLGLTFDHFVKSVLLPQGQFAAFLHDDPRGRQGLIEKLLDMGIYERVREKAVERAAVCRGLIDEATHRLEGLADVTPERVEEARRRAEERRKLRREVFQRLPQLESMDARLADLNQQAERLQRAHELLLEVAVPDEVVEAGRHRQEIEDTIAESERRTVELEAEEEELRERLAAVPDDLAETINLHQEHVRVSEALSAATEATAAARAEAERARREHQAAVTAREEAETRLDEIASRHQAHRLARRLVVGEPCPVCGRTVETEPSLSEPGDLVGAEEQLEQARRRESESARVKDQAEKALARAEERRAQTETRCLEVESRLAGRPPLEQAQALAEERDRLKEELERNRRRLKELRADLGRLRERLSSLEEGEKEQRRRLDELRRRLAAAGLEVPGLGMGSLVEEWELLTDWAHTAAEELAGSEARLREAIEAAESDRRGLVAELEEMLAAAGLTTDGDPKETVIQAEQQAERELEELSRRLEEKKELEARRTEQERQAKLAEQLARHLRSDGFRRWLVEESLLDLAEGANTILEDLAGGAYSLRVEGADFRVVDHRNADEVRSVRTLSGGETFLVSLALALALAENLATLALGTTRIQSVFLDEGFGTLDPETLDQVVEVIHELADKGRIVGLVTHVADLAERIPVRFEVRKGPGGATVARVVA
jgi:exonuclease SbcC